MIIDEIDSVTTRWLQSQSNKMHTVFDWIKSMPAKQEHGIFELQGSAFYVNVHGYDTEPAEQCAWESHRHTVDIQYCISGGEMIEWMTQTELTPSGEYNAEKDTQKWLDQNGNRVPLTMRPGLFALFLPHELHRPKIADGTNPHIEKLVVKIDAELLGL